MVFMVKDTHLLNGYVACAPYIASMRQFQCVPTAYVNEIKEAYLTSIMFIISSQSASQY